jgi:5-methyltetrahydrofolate--homocysteine methyltransferase
MKTKLRSKKGKEVSIGDGSPTAIIGERINPFGRSGIKEALERGEIEPILRVAEEQISDGADVLNVNVASFGIDEVSVLPFVVGQIMERFDIPLCIETRNREALLRTLELGCGKPIVNSVPGEETVMEQILPIVREYGCCVVLIASDGKGIPKDPRSRFEIIGRILERAEKEGIPREDIIVDSICESVAINGKAAINTFETMKMIKEAWDLNLILGATNVSFGLPSRHLINVVFLSTAITYGLTCAITNPKILKPYIVAADLVAGRDPLARRYTAFCKAQRPK